MAKTEPLGLGSHDPAAPAPVFDVKKSFGGSELRCGAKLIILEGRQTGGGVTTTTSERRGRNHRVFICPSRPTRRVLFDIAVTSQAGQSRTGQDGTRSTFVGESVQRSRRSSESEQSETNAKRRGSPAVQSGCSPRAALAAGSGQPSPCAIIDVILEQDTCGHAVPLSV
ncbi:hypothetical protein EVAR_92614_1 [Eumeta japonica]|uniref:Uncharacterized protein n=1 Tax=Eumeta variegata TaxID=151549 RepID=A0A4C1SXJ3_EUMVA|nr:hypothetical protein EVAR_92614_1 [Eumeta japonica]